jgi:N-acetylglucosaminyldiphosphoundecaprenol N-acetyl-beta-D-mannosaminyltransferase
MSAILPAWRKAMTTMSMHVELMGLRFANLTEATTNELALNALTGGRGGWICPVNLDVLRQITNDGELRRLVAEADVVVADGMPLIWASKLQGTPLRERVAGSSIILSLSRALGERHRSIYLLGGNEGAAERAAGRLRDMCPGLRIAGWFCPRQGFEHVPERIDEIRSLLREAQPDVVFVGLGFPKQDRLIVQLRETLPHAWFVSCGISFSFVIGEVKRAPPHIQALGLEWIHRLIQEPRRLARRYLVDGLPFACQLFTTSLATRPAARRRPH